MLSKWYGCTYTIDDDNGHRQKTAGIRIQQIQQVKQIQFDMRYECMHRMCDPYFVYCVSIPMLVGHKNAREHLRTE